MIGFLKKYIVILIIIFWILLVGILANKYDASEDVFLHSIENALDKHTEK